MNCLSCHGYFPKVTFKEKKFQLLRFYHNGIKHSTCQIAFSLQISNKPSIISVMSISLSI